MALKTFAVGEVLTAADTNKYLRNTVFVRKTLGESVNASTTLHDDLELHVTLEPDSVYELSSVLSYESGTGVDFKFAFQGPTGHSISYVVHRLATSAAADTDVAINPVYTTGAAIAAGALGSGVPCFLHVHGLVTTGSTGGTFKLQWAQNVSDASATYVQSPFSYMCLRMVQ